MSLYTKITPFLCYIIHQILLRSQPESMSPLGTCCLIYGVLWTFNVVKNLGNVIKNYLIYTLLTPGKQLLPLGALILLCTNNSFKKQANKKGMKICYEQFSFKHIGIITSHISLNMVRLTQFKEFGDCCFSPFNLPDNSEIFILRDNLRNSVIPNLSEFYK